MRTLKPRSQFVLFIRQLVVIFVCGAGLVPAAWGEVKSLELGKEFADFAMNPETGDIAAIDSERGTAVLFLEKSLSKPPVKPSEPVAIGSTPVSICFKRFGDKSYFAVVCSQDSYVTILNAADLSRAAKIQTNLIGTSLVFCSQNPADPFLYFAHGSGHESRCDAIDVRGMTHAGTVASGMDAVISASGKLLYPRGPWSPSGFSCLHLTNSLSDKKPEFQQIFSEHRGSALSVPDSFDLYTANQNVLHSADLTKKLATFNFLVVAFSTTPPLIFGMPSSDNRLSDRTSKPLSLEVASYNSFHKTGEPVLLPPKFGTSVKPLVRGVGGQADFKAVTTKNKYLTDDKRQRIICCSLNQAVIIPYAEFKAPAEPLLSVTLKSADPARIGVASEYSFEVADKQVNLEFSSLPEGAKAVGNVVKWTPQPDQLGSHTLSVLLKSGELERTQTFTIEATNEFFKLPFSPQGIVLSSSGKSAFVWSYGEQNTGNIPEVQMATIDLAERKVVAMKSESLRFQSPLLDDKYVYLYESNGSFIQVHDVKTLGRIKSLYTEDSIERVAIHRGEVVLALGRSRASAFNVADFARRKLPVDGPIELTSLGPVWNDTVLDDKLEKTRLLLNLPAVATLGQVAFGIGSRNRIVGFLGEPRQISVNQPGFRQGTPAPLSSHLFRTSLELQNASNPQDPSGLGSRLILNLQDWVRGASILRLPVALKSNNQRMSRHLNPRSGAIVASNADVVAVAWDDKLYPISLPKPLPPEFKTGISLRPEHSHLTLGDAKMGVLKLPHVATGGVGKKTFTLTFSPSGMEIDEVTGVVTLQTEDLNARALDALMKELPAFPKVDPLVTLANYQKQSGESLGKLLGRKLNGIAVALPIHIRVQDEDAQVTELHYVIVTEIPVEPVKERLLKRTAEMLAQAPETRPMDPTQAPSGPVVAGGRSDTASAIAAQTEEVKRLRDKVETLESRVDLLTRQLGELIKKLDPQPPGKQ